MTGYWARTLIHQDHYCLAAAPKGPSEKSSNYLLPNPFKTGKCWELNLGSSACKGSWWKRTDSCKQTPSPLPSAVSELFLSLYLSLNSKCKIALTYLSFPSPDSEGPHLLNFRGICEHKRVVVFVFVFLVNMPTEIRANENHRPMHRIQNGQVQYVWKLCVCVFSFTLWILIEPWC